MSKFNLNWFGRHLLSLFLKRYGWLLNDWFINELYFANILIQLPCHVIPHWPAIYLITIISMSYLFILFLSSVTQLFIRYQISPHFPIFVMLRTNFVIPRFSRSHFSRAHAGVWERGMINKTICVYLCASASHCCFKSVNEQMNDASNRLLFILN